MFNQFGNGTDMAYQSIKGFRDLLPEETARWRRLENTIHDLMRRYGCGEVRLPLVEATELFARGVGAGTDIVGKEMYTFLDKSDPPESLTLRPELTAGAARAFVQHNMAGAHPLTRWYYIGAMFRYEQPQAGRYRQFSQFGMEVYGSPTPEADAEVLLAGVDLLTAIGVTNYRLRVNTLGMPEERNAYRAALLEFLRERAGQLSPESLRRMESNPLRVLDSKREEDVAATAEAPRIMEYLGEESRAHFEGVLELLRANGVEYIIDDRLVRGLDYYTRTAFEFQGLDLGAQDALGGGGRYDLLIEEVGGKPTPAVGFSFGMDRLLMAMEAAGSEPPIVTDADVFVVGLGDAARAWALTTVTRLRRAGITAECDILRRSMKAQMREANRRGARVALIAGDDELNAGQAQVKNLGTGAQRSAAIASLVEETAQELAG